MRLSVRSFTVRTASIAGSMPPADEFLFQGGLSTRGACNNSVIITTVKIAQPWLWLIKISLYTRFKTPFKVVNLLALHSTLDIFLLVRVYTLEICRCSFRKLFKRPSKYFNRVTRIAAMEHGDYELPIERKKGAPLTMFSPLSPCLKRRNIKKG